MSEEQTIYLYPYPYPYPYPYYIVSFYPVACVRGTDDLPDIKIRAGKLKLHAGEKRVNWSPTGLLGLNNRQMALKQSNNH